MRDRLSLVSLHRYPLLQNNRKLPGLDSCASNSHSYIAKEAECRQSGTGASLDKGTLVRDLVVWAYNIIARGYKRHQATVRLCLPENDFIHMGTTLFSFYSGNNRTFGKGEAQARPFQGIESGDSCS